VPRAYFRREKIKKWISTVTAIFDVLKKLNILNLKNMK